MLAHLNALLVPLIALVVSGIALVVSVILAFRQFRLARQANSLPVLVDMFREHRSRRLRKARAFVGRQLADLDVSSGLASLPNSKRELVLDLSFFYDNLGALVAYGIVDLPPVAGYLGGSVVIAFDALRDLIEAERQSRIASGFDAKWQVYFENLYLVVKERDLDSDRAKLTNWRIPIAQ